jgi:hypothetical protein
MPSKPTSTRKKAHKWSARVTEHSHALALKDNVFNRRDPKRIAASLKRSALASRSRKSDPFRSAMSMLSFYINRAGKNLPAARKKILEQAKDELRRQFKRGKRATPRRGQARNSTRPKGLPRGRLARLA